MTTTAEYVRQDFWDEAGENGITPVFDPNTRQTFLTLFDHKRPLMNIKRAECMGEPRIDMANISAWGELIDRDGGKIEFRFPLKIAYLLRFIDTKSVEAVTPFVAQGPSIDNPAITGPWGPYINQQLVDGMLPYRTPGYGLTLWPDLARPVPRQNRKAKQDFVLHLWAGLRFEDVPTPPPPPGDRILKVYWNCYARYGWYFPPLANRNIKCVSSVIVGAKPPEECDD